MGNSQFGIYRPNESYTNDDDEQQQQRSSSSSSRRCTTRLSSEECKELIKKWAGSNPPGSRSRQTYSDTSILPIPNTFTTGTGANYNPCYSSSFGFNNYYDMMPFSKNTNNNNNNYINSTRSYNSSTSIGCRGTTLNGNNNNGNNSFSTSCLGIMDTVIEQKSNPNPIATNTDNCNNGFGSNINNNNSSGNNETDNPTTRSQDFNRAINNNQQTSSGLPKAHQLSPSVVEKSDVVKGNNENDAGVPSVKEQLGPNPNPLSIESAHSMDKTGPRSQVSMMNQRQGFDTNEMFPEGSKEINKKDQIVPEQQQQQATAIRSNPTIIKSEPLLRPLSVPSQELESSLPENQNNINREPKPHNSNIIRGKDNNERMTGSSNPQNLSTILQGTDQAGNEMEPVGQEFDNTNRMLPESKTTNSKLGAQDAKPFENNGPESNLPQRLLSGVPSSKSTTSGVKGHQISHPQEEKTNQGKQGISQAQNINNEGRDDNNLKSPNGIVPTEKLHADTNGSEDFHNSIPSQPSTSRLQPKQEEFDSSRRSIPTIGSTPKTNTPNNTNSNGGRDVRNFKNTDEIVPTEKLLANTNDTENFPNSIPSQSQASTSRLQPKEEELGPKAKSITTTGSSPKANTPNSNSNGEKDDTNSTNPSGIVRPGKLHASTNNATDNFNNSTPNQTSTLRLQPNEEELGQNSQNKRNIPTTGSPPNDSQGPSGSIMEKDSNQTKIPTISPSLNVANTVPNTESDLSEKADTPAGSNVQKKNAQPALHQNDEIQPELGANPENSKQKGSPPSVNEEFSADFKNPENMKEKTKVQSGASEVKVHDENLIGFPAGSKTGLANPYSRQSAHSQTASEKDQLVPNPYITENIDGKTPRNQVTIKQGQGFETNDMSSEEPKVTNKKQIASQQQAPAVVPNPSEALKSLSVPFPSQEEQSSPHKNHNNGINQEPKSLNSNIIPGKDNKETINITSNATNKNKLTPSSSTKTQKEHEKLKNVPQGSDIDKAAKEMKKAREFDDTNKMLPSSKTTQEKEPNSKLQAQNVMQDDKDNNGPESGKPQRLLTTHHITSELTTTGDKDHRLSLPQEQNTNQGKSGIGFPNKGSQAQAQNINHGGRDDKNLQNTNGIIPPEELHATTNGPEDFPNSTRNQTSTLRLQPTEEEFDTSKRSINATTGSPPKANTSNSNDSEGPNGTLRKKDWNQTKLPSDVNTFPNKKLDLNQAQAPSGRNAQPSQQTDEIQPELTANPENSKQKESTPSVGEFSSDFKNPETKKEKKKVKVNDENLMELSPGSKAELLNQNVSQSTRDNKASEKEHVVPNPHLTESIHKVDDKTPKSQVSMKQGQGFDTYEMLPEEMNVTTKKEQMAPAQFQTVVPNPTINKSEPESLSVIPKNNQAEVEEQSSIPKSQNNGINQEQPKSYNSNIIPGSDNAESMNYTSSNNPTNNKDLTPSSSTKKQKKERKKPIKIPAGSDETAKEMEQGGVGFNGTNKMLPEPKTIIEQGANPFKLQLQPQAVALQPTTSITMKKSKPLKSLPKEEKSGDFPKGQQNPNSNQSSNSPTQKYAGTAAPTSSLPLVSPYGKQYPFAIITKNGRLLPTSTLEDYDPTSNKSNIPHVQASSIDKSFTFDAYGNIIRNNKIIVPAWLLAPSSSDGAKKPLKKNLTNRNLAAAVAASQSPYSIPLRAFPPAKPMPITKGQSLQSAINTLCSSFKTSAQAQAPFPKSTSSRSAPPTKNIIKTKGSSSSPNINKKKMIPTKKSEPEQTNKAPFKSLLGFPLRNKNNKLSSDGTQTPPTTKSGKQGRTTAEGTGTGLGAEKGRRCVSLDGRTTQGTATGAPKANKPPSRTPSTNNNTKTNTNDKSGCELSSPAPGKQSPTTRKVKTTPSKKIIKKKPPAAAFSVDTWYNNMESGIGRNQHVTGSSSNRPPRFTPTPYYNDDEDNIDDNDNDDELEPIDPCLSPQDALYLLKSQFDTYLAAYSSALRNTYQEELDHFERRSIARPGHIPHLLRRHSSASQLGLNSSVGQYGSQCSYSSGGPPQQQSSSNDGCRYLDPCTNNMPSCPLPPPSCYFPTNSSPCPPCPQPRACCSTSQGQNNTYRVYSLNQLNMNANNNNNNHDPDPESMKNLKTSSCLNLTTNPDQSKSKSENDCQEDSNKPKSNDDFLFNLQQAGVPEVSSSPTQHHDHDHIQSSSSGLDFEETIPSSSIEELPVGFIPQNVNEGIIEFLSNLIGQGFGFGLSSADDVEEEEKPQYDLCHSHGHQQCQEEENIDGGRGLNNDMVIAMHKAAAATDETGHINSSCTSSSSCSSTSTNHDADIDTEPESSLSSDDDSFDSAGRGRSRSRDRFPSHTSTATNPSLKPRKSQLNLSSTHPPHHPSLVKNTTNNTNTNTFQSPRLRDHKKLKRQKRREQNNGNIGIGKGKKGGLTPEQIKLHQNTHKERSILSVEFKANLERELNEFIASQGSQGQVDLDENYESSKYFVTFNSPPSASLVSVLKPTGSTSTSSGNVGGENSRRSRSRVRFSEEYELRTFEVDQDTISTSSSTSTATTTGGGTKSEKNTKTNKINISNEDNEHVVHASNEEFLNFLRPLCISSTSAPAPVESRVNLRPASYSPPLSLISSPRLTRSSSARGPLISSTANSSTSMSMSMSPPSQDQEQDLISWDDYTEPIIVNTPGPLLLRRRHGGRAGSDHSIATSSRRTGPLPMTIPIITDNHNPTTSTTTSSTSSFSNNTKTPDSTTIKPPHPHHIYDLDFD